VTPAIIIGGGSGNGLGIARNLGRLGIPVYCLTSDPQELTLSSRFCAGARIVPQIESDPVRLSACLRRLTHHLPGSGVLFPTTDTTLLTVARIRDAVPTYLTYIPARAIVETMVIKSQFYRSLQDYAVPHPRTLYPDDARLEQHARDIGFPLFIRPAQSLLFHERVGGKGFVAQNLRELRGYLRLARRLGLEVMVQEIIPGPPATGYTIWGYIDQRSHLNVRLVTQKVRKPLTFANATVIVSVPPSVVSDFEPVVLAYLRALHYQGMFGAEFKRDPRDGVWKLLEINARSMGGNEMALSCGVNHVLAAYRDVLGDPMPPQLAYHTGVSLINALGDFTILLKRGVQGHFHPHDLRPYRGRIHWAVYARDDPLPFLQTISRAASLLPRAFRASARGS
jgi:predicted ATP-grasp superfamily ATP-dependent carboligase